jgi:hypothetical protein
MDDKDDPVGMISLRCMGDSNVINRFLKLIDFVKSFFDFFRIHRIF